MTITPKAIAKGSIATLTAGAMAMASATPAFANDQRDRHRGGPSAGEVIAGAVVLGGLAAILASGNKDRGYRDRGYRDRGYDRNYDNGRDRAQQAVEQCVRAAERQARRWSGSRAEVYEIRDVDRERGGFEVKGRIAVREGHRGRGYNDGYRNRSDRSDYRRGYRNTDWDEGRFTCDYRRGQVVDVNFRGIRGL